MARMIQLDMTIDRNAFNDCCTDITNEQAEQIAAANPELFKGALRLAGSAPSVTKAPRTRKSASPKPSETIDAEAVKAKVLSHVVANPGQSSEAIAKACGLDLKAVKKALDKMVAADDMIADGERRGKKYTATREA